jgi:MarR family transcriptional regulator, lower aerobic nicotinate degradation pathway regulator
MLDAFDASRGLSSMDEFYRMPGHLIRRAQQISTAIFAEECGPFDLTSVQFAALSAIKSNPGVDATRLSALIAFDRSTIGDVLERMEAKGWIERYPDARDRRVKLLRLSAAGATLLRRVMPAVRRVQARLLAPLSEADRETMLRLLSTLSNTYNEVTAAPLREVAVQR